MAIKNNPHVVQSAFQVASNRIRHRQARASLLPSLSGNASRSLYNGKSVDPYTNQYVNQQYTADNYGLNAQLLLWQGSSLRHYVRQQALAYEASRMDMQQATDEITVQVILSYLTVLNNREQWKMALQQTEVSRQQVQRLTVLQANGAIAPSELYNMRGQLAANELAALKASQALETARLNLTQLMNVPYDTALQVEPIPGELPLSYGTTLDEVIARAADHLAILKAATLHEKSAEQGVKVARGQMLPSLSLSGGLYTNYSSAAATNQLTGTRDQATDHYVLINGGKTPVYAPVSSYIQQKVPYEDQWKNNFNSGLSLSLHIPLFNGLQARSQLRQAQITEKTLAFQRKTAELELRQAIERDYLSLTNAFDTYKKLAEQVSDYKESFREAKVKFEAGVMNAVEFMLVQNYLDQASLSLIAAKYNYLAQTKILDYYQGLSTW